MAEMVETGAGSATSNLSRRWSAERLVITSLVAAMLIWLALRLGLAGTVAGFFPGEFAIGENEIEWGDVVVFWLPFLPLIASAIGLWRVKQSLVTDFSFTQNRLRRHYIGWYILAAFSIFMQFFGEPLEDVFDVLGKSGGIMVEFFADNGYFWALVLFLIGTGVALVGSIAQAEAAPGQVERSFSNNLASKIAAIPMALVAMGVFAGGTIWTIVYSFTDSKLLPRTRWVGWDQYIRLWGENRWLISIKNLAIYGLCSLVLSLLIGFILAALLDQKIRFENTFRTIFLYPFALSFIVTGLVWQWILNPEFGLQSVLRMIPGLGELNFDPLYNQDIVIFGLLIAGLWQGTGLVMCLMLAGLRGIDQDIWKATRVDGIPMWRTYISVVIPMMRPVFITTLVLIASGIVRLYDLVVAQTSGGPGIASEVPAKYVYDKMFLGQNLAQGFAASTVMLVTVFVILIPWAYLEFGERRQQND